MGAAREEGLVIGHLVREAACLSGFVFVCFFLGGISLLLLLLLLSGYFYRLKPAGVLTV